MGDSPDLESDSRSSNLKAVSKMPTLLLHVEPPPPLSTVSGQASHPRRTCYLFHLSSWDGGRVSLKTVPVHLPSSATCGPLSVHENIPAPLFNQDLTAVPMPCLLSSRLGISGLKIIPGAPCYVQPSPSFQDHVGYDPVGPRPSLLNPSCLRDLRRNACPMRPGLNFLKATFRPQPWLYLHLIYYLLLRISISCKPGTISSPLRTFSAVLRWPSLENQWSKGKIGVFDYGSPLR